MTIQLIENKHFPFLFIINNRNYSMHSWRTLIAEGVELYTATTKGTTLGWYTVDGWISYNQIKKAICKSK